MAHKICVLIDRQYPVLGIDQSILLDCLYITSFQTRSIVLITYFLFNLLRNSINYLALAKIQFLILRTSVCQRDVLLSAPQNKCTI